MGAGMSASPWEVSDELWALVEPLLPVPERVFGRPRVSDRAALEGILFVLVTGIPWRALPQQLGYGSGVTCWRRLEAWTQAEVWEQLHAVLLAKLRSVDRIDWSRACVDGSHVQAKKGARKRARARSIVGGWAQNTT
jgi:transposase